MAGPRGARRPGARAGPTSGRRRLPGPRSSRLGVRRQRQPRDGGRRHERRGGRAASSLSLSIWDMATAPTVRSNPDRYERHRAGCEIPLAGERLHHRRALLQGPGNIGPTSGHLWSTPGPSWPRPRSPTRRPRDGSGSPSRRRYRSLPTRRMSRRTIHRRVMVRSIVPYFALGSRESAAGGPRHRPGRLQRSVRGLVGARSVPERDVRGRRTIGSMSSSRRRC